ncbi:MAG: hypothetical protein IK025_08705 [Bacteroidales bacterium]|nr:hypothetical protein [Bacteroidales bacterium]
MSEYYSVIQLLATLAIGFVILGYSDFFIETLKKNFFRANDIILEIENECMKIIPDNDTLNGLEITNVGDGNTEEQIKELKRKCDEMKTNKIPSFNKESEEYLNKICILNSLAPMSLFVFMYTTILLIIPGLTYEYLIDFLTIFSLFCGIYMFLGWIFGEKDCKKPLNAIQLFVSLRY